MTPLPPNEAAPETAKLPEIKNVPAAAQAEMQRLFNETQDAYKAFKEKEKTAVELIRATRRELGIQDHEVWDISNDGSKFIKVDVDEEQRQLIEEINAQYAEGGQPSQSTNTDAPKDT